MENCPQVSRVYFLQLNVFTGSLGLCQLGMPFGMSGRRSNSASASRKLSSFCFYLNSCLMASSFFPSPLCLVPLSSLVLPRVIALGTVCVMRVALYCERPGLTVKISLRAESYLAFLPLAVGVLRLILWC
ncbi:hypothetical protein TorRG33x02_175550 [Trema orientale]|uniref:Transmembrane protein n=1 Tax=Trema orientale TaxID=63057 RepID=A0A2P5EM94_TREOI|nr:hypothetical protein TorRG33x02_175550 [Trema orientale]